MYKPTAVPLLDAVDLINSEVCSAVDYLVEEHAIPPDWKQRFAAAPHDRKHEEYTEDAISSVDETDEEFTPERLKVGFDMLALRELCA